MEVTNFQKTIYNKYLSTIRKEQGKPFRYRKDFSNLDDKTLYELKKLEKFFNRFPNIDVEIYFRTPFILHPEEQGFIPLQRYNTRKSLKDYTIIKKRMIYDSPDSEYNIEKIVKSLKFIAKFIKNKNIKLNEYLTCSSNNYLPDYVMHLKNDNISFYVLFGFYDFDEQFSKISKEDKNLLFLNFYTDWYILKRKYYNSKKAKKLITLGMKKISNMG